MCVYNQSVFWIFSHLQRCFVSAGALLKTTNSCRRTNPLPTNLLLSITTGDKTSPLKMPKLFQIHSVVVNVLSVVGGNKNFEAEAILNDFLRSFQTWVLLWSYDRWQCGMRQKLHKPENLLPIIIELLRQFCHLMWGAAWTHILIRWTAFL